MKKQYITGDFSGLPFKALNKILFLDLQTDAVHVSVSACRHIEERHPSDYFACMELLPIAIADPDFAGVTPRHPSNFFLIKSQGNKNLLVAINNKLNKYGKYPLQSCYFIDSDTLNRRLRQRFINPLK